MCFFFVFVLKNKRLISKNRKYGIFYIISFNYFTCFFIAILKNNYVNMIKNKTFDAKIIFKTHLKILKIR